MPDFSPTLPTITLIAVFVALYMGLLLVMTIRGGLDLYEFLMLSMVAIVPAVFTFFPEFTNLVGRFFGVAFPFLVMFGALFVVIFLFLHRLTVKMHRLEKRSRLLIQENGLLRQMLTESRKGA